MRGGTVNSQITDAVTQSDTAVIGLSPSLSLSFTYAAAAQSISRLMSNAVTTQHGSQICREAATAVTCAMILAFGMAGAVPK